MAIPAFKGMVNRLLNVAIPTFGERVTYFPQGNRGAYRLIAVFDRAHLFVDPETETVVSTRDPQIGVNLNGMPEEPQQGDRVRIYNHIAKCDEYFEVDDIQPDGQGGAALILHKLDDPKQKTNT